MSLTVDIVMPWVDGADPVWLEEKQKYNPNDGEDANINRYRDWGLLKFWFRSVEKYAPWVNKIHFITYGHLPVWLNTENPKLHIVKHEDYIPREFLPVFSSHPIELNMNKIDGLAERFIYSNDDLFFLNNTLPNDFFIDGKPVDLAAEAPFCFFEGGIDHIVGNDIAVLNKHFNKREVIKRNRKLWFSLSAPRTALKNLYMLPVKAFSAFANPHIMQPFLKSTLEEVWNEEEELLRRTSSHKFRSHEDVNSWLFRYWQYAKGDFVQSGEVKGMFFSIGKDDAAIREAILENKYKTICISDDLADIDFEKEQEFLIGLFQTVFPDKCSFEK